MKNKMSKMRKIYIARLIGRCLVLIIAGIVCALRPEWFDVVKGLTFFREISILHLLWIIWMIDMVFQLIPVKDRVPLGSQKLFEQRFRPIKEKINSASLRRYIVSTTKSAYKVFLLWSALVIVLGILYFAGILNEMGLVMASIIFYVCDLVCVLIWCPFRLMMRTKCCTTCRIFNWDHIMMFSPLIYINGFFTRSLFIVALIVWLVWELCIMMYPERFWEASNEALQCSNCTDKLCTQYCRKLIEKKVS